MKSAVLEKPATKCKFVCPNGYALELVMQSAGTHREVDGHILPNPFKHINFRKEGYGAKEGYGFWRGAYVTSDPSEIEFIRTHDWFREGPPPEPRFQNGEPVNESAGGTNRLIYEIPYDPKDITIGPKQIIRRGDVEEKPQEIVAPTETTPPPTKARVPKLKRT